MLNPRKKVEKLHTQMMEDAYSEIPIYSKEWTNYNPSDPGITILENLLAFELLQYNQLDETSDRVKLNLLKMAGFELQKGSSARVLLEPVGLQESVVIPANQKFWLGSMCFETAKEKRIEGCQITGIYTCRNGKYYDYSYILDPEITIAAQVFGENPQVGDEIYLVMNAVPEPLTENIFYLTTSKEGKRNPLGEKDRNRFAKLEWECYTEAGFVSMNVKDETECFLVDGELRFRMPAEAAAIYQQEDINGYVFRGRLVKAQYDIAPRLLQLSGFLFEVWQKDTQALVYTFPKSQTITINSELMEQEHYKVLCKEEKGNSYRMYSEVWEESGKGRYYTTTHPEAGVMEIHFDKHRFGFAPERLKHAVKVVVYNEELMSRYYLGEVFGYDNQIIDLPKTNLIADSFSLLAVREDEQGELLYDFVKPNRKQDEELIYRLYENEGKLQILDAGAYIGAKLYLASVTTIRGDEGNIREGNEFHIKGNLKYAARFVNPAPGKGGRYMETLEDTRKRYVQDLYKPYTAVSAADYEDLVRTTPGLCIHKVKAYMNYEKNRVEIAVKPNTKERFPVLSSDYLKILHDRLEQCRLLSTKVEILQPVYLPVQVQGVIYVRRHYENCREQIEQVLREELDYISGPQSFGEVVSFDRMFRKLELLECVSHVYDLAIYPQSNSLAVKHGSDIIPKANCLCYPGSFNLEIHTNELD